MGVVAVWGLPGGLSMFSSSCIMHTAHPPGIAVRPSSAVHPPPHPTELEALRLPGVERVRGVQWLQYSRVTPSSSYVGESYVALCILSTRDSGRYEVLDTVEFDTVFVRQAAVEGDFGMGGRTPF